jgi:hypothetical protein
MPLRAEKTTLVAQNNSFYFTKEIVDVSRQEIKLTADRKQKSKTPSSRREIHMKVS